MNPDNHLLVGVRSRVMAVSKLNGEVFWSTELPGGSIGESFVTLLSDGSRIFAHTRGQLHCLDFATGRLLWTNELKGCGFGLASLALHTGTVAPGPALVSAMLKVQQARNSD